MSDKCTVVAHPTGSDNAMAKYDVDLSQFPAFRIDEQCRDLHTYQVTVFARPNDEKSGKKILVSTASIVQSPTGILEALKHMTRCHASRQACLAKRLLARLAASVTMKRWSLANGGISDFLR